MGLRNLLIFLILLGAGYFVWLISTTPTPPQPPPPAEPLADYGDAPDGDLGMDTGYYAPIPGPVSGVMVYDNAGIDAEFPTVGADPVPGPFLLDVDEFWIGPFRTGPVFGLPPTSAPGDIPSLEAGVRDPTDPDQVPNLDPVQPIPTKADCDKENASHTPSATGCNPVPPYAIDMGGVLVIWISSRVNAFFMTRVWVAQGANTEGIAYWNMLFDLVRDGEWGTAPGSAVDEWVARDEVFPVVPGTNRVLVTQPFPWPTSGAFGRLIFPVWARNMVSSESVRDAVGGNSWDGRGPAGGFQQGEVEDYFIEWTPIGQILPGAPGGGPGGGDGDGDGDGDRVAADVDPNMLGVIACPETLAPGDSATCETDLGDDDMLLAVCREPDQTVMASSESDIPGSGGGAELCGQGQITVVVESGAVTVTAGEGSENFEVALVIRKGKAQARGTGNVLIARGALLKVESAPAQATP